MKRRRSSTSGRIDFWNQYKGYGFATFDGYSERVLFHVKDCKEIPIVGDAVSGHVHRRRRDGKLQAFNVGKVVVGETEDQRLERVHATLIGSS